MRLHVCTKGSHLQLSYPKTKLLANIVLCDSARVLYMGDLYEYIQLFFHCGLYTSHVSLYICIYTSTFIVSQDFGTLFQLLTSTNLLLQLSIS